MTAEDIYQLKKLMTQRLCGELVCFLALAGVAVLPDKSTAVNQRESGDAREKFHRAPIARHIHPTRSPIQAPAPGVAHAKSAKRTRPGHLSEQNGPHLSKVDPNIPAADMFSPQLPRHIPTLPSST